MRIIKTSGFMFFPACLLLLMFDQPGMAQTAFQLTSPAFKHNQMIPVKYTCKGEDISPPLHIQNIPAGTEALVLIVDDPDAPMGTWVHWVVYDILPSEYIAENSVPGRQVVNSFGKIEYGGPCPPSGTHRYFFKLYALDTRLMSLEEGTLKDVVKAMEGHVLGKAELIGLFKK